MNKLINGQNIVDKIVTAKHAIAGQDVPKAVLKATTDDISLPKRKHLDYLVMCTDNPNINILDMSKLLLDRAQNPHWMIAFKALLTIHNIMNYGSEVFFQHMASNSFSLSFDSFSDTSNATALHMSRFVRSYANYINSKSVSFRILGFDFCKVKRGNSDSFFRKLETQKLIESLSRLQTQIDHLLSFDASSRDLSNVIINSAFAALFKDLVRIFICYKDGMMNLKDKFFGLDKKLCREAASIYRKFATQVQGIEGFFNLAEDMGVEKYDIPKKVEISPQLMEAFENHLKSLESNKKPVLNSSTPLQKLDDKKLISMQRHSSVVERKTFPTEFEEFDTGPSSLPISEADVKEVIKDEGILLDAFKQQNLIGEPMSSPFQNCVSMATPRVSIQRNRPTSIHSAPKVPFNEPSVESGDIFSSFDQTSNPLPPPGFMGSGQILQPTKLHSPPPTLDFSKVSLGSHPVGPAMYQFNNLHNPYVLSMAPYASPGNGVCYPPHQQGHMFMFPSHLNQVHMPPPSHLGNPFT